jgi:hypothetical protein
MNKKTQHNGETLFTHLLESTPDRDRDTGLAMVLLCLLLVYFGDYSKLIPLAIILMLLSMLYPTIFHPLAWLWFGIAHVLGTIVTKILLTLVFFGLVTPVGFVRRLTGADSLQLKEWKKSNESVFNVRSHVITARNLDKPY